MLHAEPNHFADALADRATAFDDDPARLMGRLDLETLVQQPALAVARRREQRQAEAEAAKRLDALRAEFRGEPGDEGAPTIDADAIEARMDGYPRLARAVVWALNVAMMLLVFPVGFVATLVSLAGGEDLRFSARAMAVGGLVAVLSAEGMLPLIGSY